MTRKIAMVAALIVMSGAAACGTKDDAGTDKNKTTTTLSFGTDIAPIVQKSCGTAACHASGATQTVYVDNEANFKSHKASVILQVESGAMPSDGNITAADKAKLLEYVKSL